MGKERFFFIVNWPCFVLFCFALICCLHIPSQTLERFQKKAYQPVMMEIRRELLLIPSNSLFCGQ